VKAIARRLRRLEDQARQEVNERGGTLAVILWKRRRRRLEAAGLPFEDPPWVDLRGARSFGEELSLCLRRARKSRVRNQNALGSLWTRPRRSTSAASTPAVANPAGCIPSRLAVPSPRARCWRPRRGSRSGTRRTGSTGAKHPATALHPSATPFADRRGMRIHRSALARP
jgi:hypothetical protein